MPDLPQGLFTAGAGAYDMVYGAAPTAFMVWAEASGAGKISDGLGMLVEQAAISFFIWTGKQPESGIVIDACRSGDISQQADPGTG